MNPNHVAIIMDGNRRWARAHKLPIIMGHRKAAYEMIEPLADAAIEWGISYITLWAFSTENWHREKSEVEGLLSLFRETLTENINDLHKKGVRVKAIGDIAKFPADIYQKLLDGEEQTKKNTKLTLTLALNYGGRDEIVRAVNKLRESGKWGVESGSIKKEDISNNLDTANIPDPDLIIRTGGEQRLSGFMMWQSEYSELYFTEVYFPDFSKEEFQKAVEEYKRRQRRFGR